MKYIYKTLLKSSLLFIMILGLFSCEKFLEKSPDSIVSEDEAFKNFLNFQGFIEEMYNCIPDKEKCYWTTSYNWGDDELFNLEGSWHMTNQVDLGNFWGWQAGKLSQAGSWLDKSTTNPTCLRQVLGWINQLPTLLLLINSIMHCGHMPGIVSGRQILVSPISINLPMLLRRKKI